MSASANPSVEAAAATSSAAFTELRQEGNEHFRQKQFGLAIASYTATSLAGDFIAASNAAEAFLCLHQPEDAEKHCRRALALNSNVQGTIFLLIFFTLFCVAVFKVSQPAFSCSRCPGRM